MRISGMLAGVCLLGAGPALAQEHAGAMKAIKTTLVGDLDAARGAAQFGAALDLAREQNQWALVELGAHASDPTVAHEYICLAKDRECKLLVVISAHKDRTVDPTCLALALLADGACIPREVTFATPPESDRPPTTGTDPDLARAEMRDWLAPRLEKRNLDPDLASPLAGFISPAFLLSDGQVIVPPSLPEGSSPADGIPLISKEGVSITRAALDRLKVEPCDAERQAAKSLGYSGLRITETSEILIGAAKISESVVSLLNEAQLRLAMVGEILQLPDPDEHQMSSGTYRSASDRALQMLELVAGGLDEAESRLREAPEVMRLAPPGEPEVEKAGKSYASAWTSRIKSKRTKMERLKEKATKFGAVR